MSRTFTLYINYWLDYKIFPRIFSIKKHRLAVLKYLPLYPRIAVATVEDIYAKIAFI